MPEVTFSTVAALPLTSVWEFIKDMSNWAPMLTGYQSHTVESETDSVWVLKGDVGILSRTVQLKVCITRWEGPNHVAFTLVGQNEVVDGDGEFTAEIVEAEPVVVASSGTRVGESSRGETHAAIVGAGFVQRWLGWLFSVFYRWVYRRERATRALNRVAAQDQHAKHGASQMRPAQAARLTFRLRMDAGGPTGPLVNAMLGPALLPAATDLGEKIVAHLCAVQAWVGGVVDVVRESAA